MLVMIEVAPHCQPEQKEKNASKPDHGCDDQPANAEGAQAFSYRIL
jgi:hypothetical protein